MSEDGYVYMPYRISSGVQLVHNALHDDHHVNHFAREVEQLIGQKGRFTFTFQTINGEVKHHFRNRKTYAPRDDPDKTCMDKTVR